MQVSVLVIGQGLCGTWLTYYLQQAGISFMVIDAPPGRGASAIASGIINPVTGRRLVKTWLIDEVMPFAVEVYQNFNPQNGKLQNRSTSSLVTGFTVLDFFSAPDVEVAFNRRLTENAAYLSASGEKENWRRYFNFDFGVGEIDPCYLVDVNSLLQRWRQHLLAQALLTEDYFNESELALTDGGIRYRNIEAQQIIYCDGIASAQSAYFSRLPFAANKGEALIAAIPDLPPTHIFKKGMSLVPWKPGQYWIGSTYEWKFKDILPNDMFRQQASAWLQSFCKMRVEIVDHLAAVRPATIERRPFLGFHPLQRQVGIFNGMGTKGVSLAPYFAKHFVDSLRLQTPLMADVDIQRFAKILSR